MTRSLADWLLWQERLHPRSIELGLERVRTVAAQLHLPAAGAVTLTIGGTNGKGSSAHLAARIYREAGYRVGLYTSPHLLRYNERVSVDGREATDVELCGAFEAVESARGEVPLTYFEFGTLAALWLFRRAGVGVQVLEVGLGGRLDAVNIVDADAALVTSIGIDHAEWLGPDRDSIGREKAGIFRNGRPAIVADPDPPQGLVEGARMIGATLRLIGHDFHARAQGSGFDWWCAGRRLEALPLPGLPGAMQIQNAAGVLAAVDALQLRCPVGEQAIRRALPALRLPGRCERRGHVVLDVAHNAEAALALAATLRDEMPPARPTVLVLGMLADKPHAAFYRALDGLADRLICVDLAGPRGLSACELSQRIGADASARCCDNMREALAAARRLSGSTGRIVVTGSFLTVAAALTELDG